MKKWLGLLLIASVLAIAGCSKEEKMKARAEKKLAEYLEDIEYEVLDYQPYEHREGAFPFWRTYHGHHFLLKNDEVGQFFVKVEDSYERMETDFPPKKALYDLLKDKKFSENIRVRPSSLYMDVEEPFSLNYGDILKQSSVKFDIDIPVGGYVSQEDYEDLMELITYFETYHNDIYYDLLFWHEPLYKDDPNRLTEKDLISYSGTVDKNLKLEDLNKSLKEEWEFWKKYQDEIDVVIP